MSKNEIVKSRPNPNRVIFLIILSIIYAVDLYGSNLEWTERERQFLTALTSERYNSSDFGTEPTSEEKSLLQKFKPRVVISPGSWHPIDFYRDYLPKTVVRDSQQNKNIVSRSPSRNYLKKIERNKRYYIDLIEHIPLLSIDELQKYSGTGYGRVYYETVNLYIGVKGTIRKKFIFLKYTFVFPYSGLSEGLSWYKKLFIHVLGNSKKWHELDIHGAVYIGLDMDLIPVVLILGQHNHFRTYLVNKDLRWPEDNRVIINFSKYSNEPYIHSYSSKPVYHRAIATPEYVYYLLTGKEKPMLLSGIDITYGLKTGGIEIPYSLKFLPDKDPLYVSWIPLGDQKKIFFFFNSFSRRGPPGVDIYTWPRLKPIGELMQFWYIQDGDEEDADLFKQNCRSFFEVNFEPILEHNRKQFYNDLRNIKSYTSVR